MLTSIACQRAHFEEEWLDLWSRALGEPGPLERPHGSCRPPCGAAARGRLPARGARPPPERLPRHLEPDEPPYFQGRRKHIKLRFDGYVITSMLLIRVQSGVPRAERPQRHTARPRRPLTEGQGLMPWGRASGAVVSPGTCRGGAGAVCLSAAVGPTMTGVSAKLHRFASHGADRQANQVVA